MRSKLNGIKKGASQDFLNFSEHESAQIYYDDKGKVTAISIDYFGDSSGAPTTGRCLSEAARANLE